MSNHRLLLTDKQTEDLIRMRDEKSLPWDEIGRNFGMNGEWARGVYRRARRTAPPVKKKVKPTTGGTMQQEDTRWQKTFRLGREICVWMIETCSQIAPVDVLIIPGNHDESRSFYLGDALYCWFRNNPNVRIDNSADKQKYYEFGKVMLGFAHGYDEDLKKLPFLMAVDQPEMWARTQYREWHTGDKHHKKDLLPKADESTGMVIRIMRSLAALDAWTFNKGYRSLRASEAFVWDPKCGLVAQYTALPEIESPTIPLR